MGLAKSGIAVACAGLATVAIAGCGGSSGSLLSSDQAATLKQQISKAQTALDAHHCTAANQYVTDFANTVSGLTDVNSTLTSVLSDGAQKFQQLVSKECKATVKKQTTTTHSTPTTTTQTHSTPTVTTPTQPSTTTTTHTPTQTQTQPNSGSGGGGSSTTGGAGL